MDAQTRYWLIYSDLIHSRQILVSACQLSHSLTTDNPENKELFENLYKELDNLDILLDKVKQLRDKK